VATHVVVASSTTIPTATTAASVAAAAPARLPTIAAATFEREDVDRRGRGVIIKGLILMREATLCASIAAWGGWFTVAAHCGVGKTQTTTPAIRQAARGGAGDAVSTRVSHCTCDVCVSCLCVCRVCVQKPCSTPPPLPFVVAFTAHGESQGDQATTGGVQNGLLRRCADGHAARGRAGTHSSGSGGEGGVSFSPRSS
jgi:hypothetical protein